jgi:hypothetical protein
MAEVLAASDLHEQAHSLANGGYEEFLLLDE